MRYFALACDYDGTLAHHGTVDCATLAALERLKASGRKLILVTGRILEDLLPIFPHTDLFDMLVVENGAVLYRPGQKEEKVIGQAPPPRLVCALRNRLVVPLSLGRCIIATWEPHETAALEVIRDLGLEWQVIFNKGAVMLLPPGVNKASGLAAALKQLELSPHNVVGVGDAENDHAFLQQCECSAAVANALPTVKEEADIVTSADHGAGVVELIDELLARDLAGREAKLTRHHILLGAREDGEKVRLRPYGTNVLIAGPSASGKSTTVTALLERLAEHRYQFCVIDPEGDYETFQQAVPLGDNHHAPPVEEMLRLLKDPGQNAVVNLTGLPLADRPSYFLGLLPALQEARSRTGRPHWIVVDEAHHLLPPMRKQADQALPGGLNRMLLVTVHPDQVAPSVLSSVDTVIAVGQDPEETFERFCRATGRKMPRVPPEPLESGEILLWYCARNDPPIRVRVTPAQTERLRHSRKYAEGRLPPDRSFYFQGPEKKFNLRAQNLFLFLQLAEGLDDETWLHHLHHGDYSRWFRDVIKDEGLADEVAAIEARKSPSRQATLAEVKHAIEQRYTLPASDPTRVVENPARAGAAETAHEEVPGG
jgi:hydroxymethylpyrimidine pyrophosphatase-like HAD family hydrolase/energy-coupling factor transporter ATP-binding protein EcfA2